MNIILHRIVFLVARAVTRLTGASLNAGDFSVTSDGTPLDTTAINNAICAAAAVGDSTVEYPAGMSPCISIHLKSHFASHLGMGATNIAAEPPAYLAYGLMRPFIAIL